jgi:hypothetical protein
MTRAIFCSLVVVVCAQLVCAQCTQGNPAGCLIGKAGLEMNLAFVPFDHYFENSTGYLPSNPGYCDSSMTVQQCFRNYFAAWYRQGLVGVRFFVGLGGVGGSTAFNNDETGTIRTGWPAAVAAFLQDVKAAGITRITPALALEGAEYPYVFWRTECVYNCGDPERRNQIWRYFSKWLPFVLWDPNGFPEGQGDNTAYNSAAQNPDFWGWGAGGEQPHGAFGVVDVLLSQVPAGLIVEEFEIEQEVDLLNFTVMGRLIYDWTTEPDVDVLAGVRSLMEAHFPGSGGRVTYSTTGETLAKSPPAAWQASHPYVLGDLVNDGANIEECVQAGTSRSPDPPQWNSTVGGYTQDNTVVWRNFGLTAPYWDVDGFDCGSVYGDTAMISHESALTAALWNGLIGMPYDLGSTARNGLPCVDYEHDPPQTKDMFRFPYCCTEPAIQDIHWYLCILAFPRSPTTLCYEAGQLAHPQLGIYLPSDYGSATARNLFDGIWNFFAYRGFTTGHQAMLGETNPTEMQTGVHQNPYEVITFNRSMAYSLSNGFNGYQGTPSLLYTNTALLTNSGAAVTSLRPWQNIPDQYYTTPNTINPPYTPVYLVGDVYPPDPTTGAPPIYTDFGNGTLNITDLIMALRAVTGIPGYMPPTCSDRFDATDSYPVDAPPTRGGDGVLNTSDLTITLRRVTGVDPSRPVRTPLRCQVGQRSSAAAPPSQTGTPSLQFGSPEQLQGGGLRVPVYLRVTAAKRAAGVAFAARLRNHSLTLQFAPASNPATVVDNGLPGIVAVAFLYPLDLTPGNPLLLGWIEIGDKSLAPSAVGFDVFKVLADDEPARVVASAVSNPARPQGILLANLLLGRLRLTERGQAGAR